jgi:hypothetical protein
MFALRGRLFAGTINTSDLSGTDEIFWVAATARSEEEAAAAEDSAKELHAYRLKVASAWFVLKDHPNVTDRQREAWLRVFGTGLPGGPLYTEGETETKAGAAMGGISKPAINKLIRKAFRNAGLKRFRPGHRS